MSSSGVQSWVNDRRQLNLNLHNGTGGDFSDRLPHAGHQRPKVVYVVGLRNHDNHREVEAKQILLILDTLINCEKDIEFLSGEAEERAVLCPGPPHFIYGANIVPR